MGKENKKGDVRSKGYGSSRSSFASSNKKSFGGGGKKGYSSSSTSATITKKDKKAALDRDDVYDNDNEDNAMDRMRSRMEAFDDASEESDGGEISDNAEGSGKNGNNNTEDTRMRNRMEAFDDASGASGSEDEYDDDNAAADYGDDYNDDEEEEEEEEENAAMYGDQYDSEEDDSDQYEDNHDDSDDEPVATSSKNNKNGSTNNNSEYESHLSLAERLAYKAQKEEEDATHGKVGDKRSRSSSLESTRKIMKAKRTKERLIREKQEAAEKEAKNPTVQYGIGLRQQQEKDRIESKNMFKTKIHKNAPAEMRSNKPVRRFRDYNIDHSLAKKKVIDPRFSDANGELSDKHFYKNYDFLNEYQSSEITKLNKAIKKTKSFERRTQLKEEARSRSQNLSERKRAMAVQDKMDEIYREEKAKVAQGKKAYFLKRADKKAIAMDVKFDELKKDGKLKDYMEKRRTKNAKLDRRWMPEGREQME
jgi:ribosomal RNA-processing protein 36